MIPSQIDDEIHRASRKSKLRNAKLTTLLLAMYRNHQNSAKLQNFQLCQLIFLFVPLKMEKPNRRRQKKKKKKKDNSSHRWKPRWNNSSLSTMQIYIDHSMTNMCMNQLPVELNLWVEILINNQKKVKKKRNGESKLKFTSRKNHGTFERYFKLVSE